MENTSATDISQAQRQLEAYANTYFASLVPDILVDRDGNTRIHLTLKAIEHDINVRFIYLLRLMDKEFVYDWPNDRSGVYLVVRGNSPHMTQFLRRFASNGCKLYLNHWRE